MYAHYEHAWERVCRTPPAFQRWIDKKAVVDVFRDASAPGLLTEVGVTSKDDHFEAFDVWNVALLSGSRRTRPELEMAYTARLLTQHTRPDDIAPLLLSASASCPRGRECESEEWSAPQIADGVTWRRETRSSGGCRWMGDHRLAGVRDTVLSAPVRDAWLDIVNLFTFHYTQPELALDATMTRERRVGDCTALSVVTRQEMELVGVNARLRSGYLLGGLTARPHQLVEVIDEDGTFKALDPTLAILAKDVLPSWLRESSYGSRPSRVLLDPVGASQIVTHVCLDRTEVDVPLELAVRRRL